MSKSLSNKFESFVSSQILLLKSRQKWGVIFTLATLVGIAYNFCSDESNNTIQVIMTIQHMGNYHYLDDNLISLLSIILKITLLPIISFLIIVGMYVYNDLVDADLDKINGKKRPIPMSAVSKNQAAIFVIITNGLGIIFSISTLDLNCIIMTVMLVAVGILYSIPKIALKDRFIIKTLCISSAMMLCLMIGGSAGITATTMNTSIYPALMLGIMVFITSPLNDLGDILGDKAVGRKTIPIVMGKENTVKLAIALAISLPIISSIAYSIFSTKIGMYSPILVSVTSILIIITMIRTLKCINEPGIGIKFLKKKAFPLHMILQTSLTAGSILVLFSR
jgi:geranylgeranylglycerol-phosphate geranylgeranyltransferase